MRYRNKTTNEDFHTGAKAFVRDFGLTGTLPSRSIQEHKMATPCGNLRRLVQIYLDITGKLVLQSLRDLLFLAVCLFLPHALCTHRLLRVPGVISFMKACRT